jgi:hypothetical protein
MRDRVKQMIRGTPLEQFARRLHAAFTRDPLAGKNNLYDRQTLEVMKRVLQENSNCIDVGCHQGSVLNDMLR